MPETPIFDDRHLQLQREINARGFSVETAVYPDATVICGLKSEIRETGFVFRFDANAKLTIFEKLYLLNAWLELTIKAIDSHDSAEKLKRGRQ